MGLSLIAMGMVRSAYNRYSQVPASSGLTGAQLAQRILDANGISDVTIHAAPGTLTDHYDPTHKRLLLSEPNYHGTSVAALGVSAHECGHAIQHQHAYAPLQWRMAAVGITSIVASPWLMMVAVFGAYAHIIPGKTALMILSVAYGALMLFQLVTLPVEFDATARCYGRRRGNARNVQGSGRRGVHLRGGFHHGAGEFPLPCIAALARAAG
jgi:hypothetical protein